MESLVLPWHPILNRHRPANIYCCLHHPLMFGKWRISFTLGGSSFGMAKFSLYCEIQYHWTCASLSCFFLPEASFGLRVLSLPASVRPSVSPSVTKFVRAITHQPFKLGSPNLDQRCKRPWLRSLLFCGMIDHNLQGQIELQSQNLPHFELVDTITHHQLKLQYPNLEQKCILALFRSLPTLGLIEIDLQFKF